MAERMSRLARASWIEMYIFTSHHLPEAVEARESLVDRNIKTTPFLLAYIVEARESLVDRNRETLQDLLV